MPAASGRAKRPQVLPRTGHSFVVRHTCRADILGVIIKDDVTVGPMSKAFLVYLLKPGITDIVDEPDLIDVGSLCLPPIITDISPWKTGLFRTLGPVPRLPNLESIVPLFRHPLNSRYFTIEGVPTGVRSPLVGEWAVWTHSGIKDLLERGL